MGRSKSERVEPYIKLEHYQMDTAAWTALSDRAVWLYLELRKQFKIAHGGDSHLTLPYSKVAWRMSRDSYCNGMAELCHYGFIKVVEQGGLERRATIYCLFIQHGKISVGKSSIKRDAQPFKKDLPSSRLIEIASKT